MKTITIELDNNLEQKLFNLSKDGGQDISMVAVEVLAQGLSERNRRVRAMQALDEVFSQPIPSPFNEMPEDDVLNIVNEEIQASRQTQ